MTKTVIKHFPSHLKRLVRLLFVTIYRHEFKTEVELRSLVFDYIETWYNRKRKHSSLGNMSPVDYKTLNRR